jgi:hypothetical protein
MGAYMLYWVLFSFQIASDFGLDIPLINYALDIWATLVIFGSLLFMLVQRKSTYLLFISMLGVFFIFRIIFPFCSMEVVEFVWYDLVMGIAWAVGLALLLFDCFIIWSD